MKYRGERVGDTFNKERFFKLLMLTQSENDNEALTAMRIANGLLQKAGMNWDAFIKDGVAWKPPEKRENRRAGEIERMLEVVLSSLSGGKAWDFVSSLAATYQRRGDLTEKQFNALKKFYVNLSGVDP